MLNIQRFVCNMFQENCYVVSDNTGECVIIDCGAFFPEEKTAIANYINDNRLNPVKLLCTHGHVDHNFGNRFVYDKYGLPPEHHKADAPLMGSLGSQAKAFIGSDCVETVPAAAKLFDDGVTITFGIHKLGVISTPGHSPGSVFLYCEEESVAFSGDTLFCMSVGRTDLELGDYDSLLRSLHLIADKLPDDTIILPGHGGRTTIKDELAHNPYMKNAVSYND